MEWNTQEFCEIVSKKFGKEHLTNVIEVQRAIQYRRRQGLFHLESLKEQVEKFSIFHASNLVPSSFTRELEKFAIRVDLHLTPLIYILCSLVNSSAYYFYLSLGLNLVKNPIVERDVTIFKIIRIFENYSDLAILLSLLKELRSGGHYHHMSALSVQGKHRIPMRVTASGAANVPFCRNDILFTSFTHIDVSYPEAKAIDVVEYEYFRCINLLDEANTSLINTLNSM
jgi:hypothetical protein